MKVLLVAGGTGGHIFPGVAIAEAFEREVEGVQIAWAGMADGMEAAIVKDRPWTFYPITAAKWKGQGLRRRFGALWTVVRAMRESGRILRRFRPDCVIGMGGYVTGPVLLAAALRRIPTLIHEQNSVPGMTNRLLGRFVRRVCTTFTIARDKFPKAFPWHKVENYGMPIRYSLVQALHRHSRTSPPPWHMLIMGGSQGAKRLNEIVCDALPRIAAANMPCHFTHVCGKWSDPEVIRKTYANAGLQADVVPFIERMETLYPSIHCAISRAGASSVAELTLAGIPTVFVPFPQAADNHQVMNVQELLQADACISVTNESPTASDDIAKQLLEHLRHPDRLGAIRARMQPFARPRAAENIVRECIALMRRSSPSSPLTRAPSGHASLSPRGEGHKDG